MAQMRIGTCSWKYDSWSGIVYSRPKPANYLAEYADQYDTVEIDQWFWSLFGPQAVSLPKPQVVDEYSRSVPDGFRFSIKIPNSITLTHYYSNSSKIPLVPNPHFLSKELFERFLESIEPLVPRLGPLMFQFEYLNRQKMPSQGRFQQQLAAFLDRIDRRHTLGVEIRNPNYLNENFFRFLKDMRLCTVFLQGYYMPSIVEVYRKFSAHLHDTIVIRLHGPGRSDIEKRSGGRWNKILEPREAELEDVAAMINDTIGRKIDVYVNVNNHYEGSAPLTIDRLREILEKNR